MSFFKGCLGVFGFWSMGAWASPGATVYPQDILDKWSSKSVQELVLPDAPAPSRANISSLFGNEYEASSYFGELLSERHLPVRLSRVEVVVGDDQLNSSRFQSHLEVLGKTHSVADPVPAALERDFWAASDLAYKSAVKQWGLKQASRSAQGGEVPADWSQAEPVQYFASSKVDFSPEDQAHLRALILAA